jgi:hypothetical protein
VNLAQQLASSAAATVMAVCATSVGAQEFGVYLNCKGQVKAGEKSLASHVDLALRRNSQLALIQSSDILPAGEKMRLDITPQFYTMKFHAPLYGSVLYYDWLRGALFVWNPDLKRLHTIRMSVDRQSAALDGEMLDGAGAVIGRLTMKCVPKDNESVAEPKF